MYVAVTADPLDGAPRLTQEDLSNSDMVLTTILFFLFWYAFMYGIFKRFGNKIIIPLTLLYLAVHMFFVQEKDGFTYVQFVLMFSSSFSELLRDDKKSLNNQYNYQAAIISLPILSMGFIESMACTSFL